MDSPAKSDGRQPWNHSVGLDIAALVNLLWWNWRCLLAGLIAGVGIGLVYLHLATPLYAASMEVASTSLEGSSNALRGMGGLAGAIGISLPNSTSKDTMPLYLAALTSDDVAADLLTKPDIAHAVFANSWNASSGRWESPDGAFGNVFNALGSFLLNEAPWHAPNAQDMRSVLLRDVSVGYVLNAPTVKITYRNPDPAFARHFLQVLNTTADNHLRQQTIDRTQKYLTYLRDRLEHTSLADQREIIIRNLSEQERSLMIASARVSYSVEIFSQPVVGVSPVYPSPGNALFVFGLLGFLASALFVLIVARRNWPAKPLRS